LATTHELLTSASRDTGGLLGFDKLAEIYNSLPEDQKKIFFNIDFRKTQTEEAVREALADA